MSVVTDVLELLGGLALVAALAVAAWTVSPALGLAAAGVGLVALSWVVSWAAGRMQAVRR